MESYLINKATTKMNVMGFDVVLSRIRCLVIIIVCHRHFVPRHCLINYTKIFGLCLGHLVTLYVGYNGHVFIADASANAKDKSFHIVPYRRMSFTAEQNIIVDSRRNIQFWWVERSNWERKWRKVISKIAQNFAQFPKKQNDKWQCHWFESVMFLMCVLCPPTMITVYLDGISAEEIFHAETSIVRWRKHQLHQTDWWLPSSTLRCDANGMEGKSWKFRISNRTFR